MEDPFFAAASDLDKILDDFEEREQPTKVHTQQVYAKKAVKPSSTAEFAPSREVIPISATCEDVTSKTTVENHHIFTPNQQIVLEEEPVRHDNEKNQVVPSDVSDTDMLIDFSSSEMSAPLPVPTQAAEQTLHELDFLLSLISIGENPDPNLLSTTCDINGESPASTNTDPKQPHKVEVQDFHEGSEAELLSPVVTTKESEQVQYSENKLSDEKAIVEQMMVKPKQTSNIPPTSVTAIKPDVSLSNNGSYQQIVGFTDNIEIDDEEFQEFLTENSDNSDNSVINSSEKIDVWRHEHGHSHVPNHDNVEKPLIVNEMPSYVPKLQSASTSEIGEDSKQPSNISFINAENSELQVASTQSITRSSVGALLPAEVSQMSVSQPKLHKILPKTMHKTATSEARVPVNNHNTMKLPSATISNASKVPSLPINDSQQSLMNDSVSKRSQLKVIKDIAPNVKTTGTHPNAVCSTEEQNLVSPVSSQNQPQISLSTSSKHTNISPTTSQHASIPSTSASVPVMNNLPNELPHSNELPVDLNEERTLRRYPSVSPPSYSSVMAGDYSAGTVIERNPPIAFSSNVDDQFRNVSLPADSAISGILPQTQVSQIEHGIEAVEESTESEIPQAESQTAESVLRTAAPTILQSQIQRPGHQKPRWVPDEESSTCTKCQAKFTFTRRRHHCRACGRVFCSQCCNERSKLEYLEYAEARVCVLCYASILQADTLSSTLMEQEDGVLSAPSEPITVPSSSSNSSPRPVLRQASVDGVGNGDPKSVRFVDGTRPDHPAVLPATPPLPSRPTRSKTRPGLRTAHYSSFPPLIIEYLDDGSYVVEEEPDSSFVLTLLHSSSNHIVTFVLSANLFVLLKRFQDDSSLCYYFISLGLDAVGQAEVALMLQVDASEDSIPIQGFTLYSYLFNNSRKGKAIHAMDFVAASDIWETPGPLFGSNDYAGIMFVRRTRQNVEDLSAAPSDGRLPLPSTTVNFSASLFALLVHKMEEPWAKLFPSRLLLGLGAKYKQFPYPLLNINKRPPVYFEVGNTILGILCDFRNYKYKVVSVPGVSVIVTDAGVTINIPSNRFSDIVRIMNSSNEHVLALGSETFYADERCQSHLVCVQDEAMHNYRTSIISCSNIETEHLTPSAGAAFVVFNGSLKSGTAQQAKCTIVEDGVMIQLLPEKMAVFKESLKAMDDFVISCNQPATLSPKQALSLQSVVSSEELDEILTVNELDNQPPPHRSVQVKWVADDTKFNIGLSSPIDFRSLEGVIGFNVQGKSEKKGKRQVLRWNQVFFFQSTNDILDMSRLAERVANGCFQALVPHLSALRQSSQMKLGVRITIDPEDVGYAVGSHGLPLPDACLNALDENLISLLHEASSSLQAEDGPVVFELIFSILEMRSTSKTVQK